MQLWQSKTFWFNVVTMLIGIVQVISNTYPIPTEWLALIVGIGNLFLRMLTDKPVGIGKFTLSKKQ